jgi:hypothetical protein
LRILLTNNTLAGRAGSEVYVRDLALGLLRRGHSPVVYSSILGEVAEDLRRATVPVIDNLDALNTPPDLIHGQHHLDAMVAILRYPTVPAVYLCHGWAPWQERPPVFPSIRRYLGVDDLCRERLLTTPGLPAERVDVVLNGVDITRFKPRPALPLQPLSALIFSNYAGPDSYADTVIRACKAHGIARVDVRGMRSCSTTATPELLLLEYDVVFAKARCALEAMAVGCAVVVADEAGLGGMVSSDNVRTLRRLNFGARTMQAEPITDATVIAALNRYDANDAASVSGFIRTDAAQESVVDRLLCIYREVLDEGPVIIAREREALAASAYMASLAGMLKEREDSEVRAVQCELRVAAEVRQREEAFERATALAAENGALREALAGAQAKSASATLESTELRSALASAGASATVAEQKSLELREILAVTRAEAITARADHQAVTRRNALIEAENESMRHALASAGASVAMLREIERSRSWRLIQTYRRVRRWMF